MEVAMFVVVGSILLIVIISNAVKIGVKEALFEFKEEIVNDLKSIDDGNKKEEQTYDVPCHK